MDLVARAQYATGARVSELLAVRRDQVDLDSERARGRVYLIESRHGQPFSRQHISRQLARASKRALGRRVEAHVLRHSRATGLYQHTRRIKAVAAMLGHSGVDTTARYYVRDDFSDAELFNGEAL
jgi:site-specific recombinase XerD